MSTTFFGSPFEPIHLSGSDKKKLENIAQAILDVNFGRFVHFSGVDQNEWKLVKVQDQIKIYSGRERQRRKRYPFQRDQIDEHLQLVLCVGSIPGTLDDVLHTVLGWSSKETIAKPSYMTDFSGAAVLASIKEPTIGNPFEALVVKWMELDVRRRSMGLVKNRDYVFVEATGIKYLPTGERLGYHVLHSVDVPGADKLPGRVRAMISVCFFFHEVNGKMVSVHATAMMDPMSDRVRRIVFPRFADIMMLIMTSTELKNLVHTRDKRYLELPELQSNKRCVTCSKRVWRLGKFSMRHTTCLVCCKYVCKSCKIDKELKVQTADQNTTTRKTALCFSCLTDAMAAHVSEFSFASDASGSSRPAYRSVWAPRLPSWSIASKGEASESSVNFSSSR